MFDSISEQTKQVLLYVFATIGGVATVVLGGFGLYRGGRALHTNVTMPMVNRMSKLFRRDSSKQKESEKLNGSSTTVNQEGVIVVDSSDADALFSSDVGGSKPRDEVAPA